MASPASAELHFWVDVLPEDDREEMLQRFERHVLDHTAQDPFLAEHPPTLERAIMRPFDGVAVPADHPVIASLVEGHRAALGRMPEITGFDAATDSMIFNLYTEHAGRRVRTYRSGLSLTRRVRRDRRSRQLRQDPGTHHLGLLWKRSGIRQRWVTSAGDGLTVGRPNRALPGLRQLDDHNWIVGLTQAHACETSDRDAAPTARRRR